MEKKRQGNEREIDTGRYSLTGGFERICICSHALGVHTAARTSNSQPCGKCDCELFKATKINMTNPTPQSAGDCIRCKGGVCSEHQPVPAWEQHFDNLVGSSYQGETAFIKDFMRIALKEERTAMLQEVIEEVEGMKSTMYTFDDVPEHIIAQANMPAVHYNKAIKDFVKLLHHKLTSEL